MLLRRFFFLIYYWLDTNTSILFYFGDGDNFSITVSSINCYSDFIGTFNGYRNVAAKVGYVCRAVVNVNITKT